MIDLLTLIFVILLVLDNPSTKDRVRRVSERLRDLVD